MKEAMRFLLSPHDPVTPQEGLRWLANALQQDPNYRPTHEVLAEYFEKDGQPEKAAHHRRRAGEGR